MGPQVYSQITALRKCPRTERAPKRFHLHVEPLMSVQPSLRFELLRTDFALKRAVVAVNHNVAPELTRQRELLPADGATVRLLSGVRPHVIVQQRYAKELLSADAADVRSYLRVHCHEMVFQSARLHERLSALEARVTSVAEMDSRVFVEHRLYAEALAAHAAHERLLACVYLQVISEFAFHREFLSAGMADVLSLIVRTLVSSLKRCLFFRRRGVYLAINRICIMNCLGCDC